MLSRLTTTIAGILLIIYGVVAGLSPLPAGVVSIVFGLLMIVAANPAARPALRRLRRRWPWFNAMVKWLGGKAPPGPIKSVAAETSPDGLGARGPETNKPP
ncbi:MAG: hypothetical protein HXY23_02285 [Parvularculaceae bacterium]|jgi:hypothetical protein|nr:hypothetical protein [Parvularculaceae bacterium]